MEKIDLLRKISQATAAAQFIDEIITDVEAGDLEVTGPLIEELHDAWTTLKTFGTEGIPVDWYEV